jgi:hypothetical protein
MRVQTEVRELLGSGHSFEAGGSPRHFNIENPNGVVGHFDSRAALWLVERLSKLFQHDHTTARLRGVGNGGSRRGPWHQDCISAIRECGGPKSVNLEEATHLVVLMAWKSRHPHP